MGLVRFDEASSLATVGSISFPLRMISENAVILDGNTRIESLDFGTRQRILENVRELEFPSETLVREICRVAVTVPGADAPELIEVVALARAGAEEPQILTPAMRELLPWQTGLDWETLMQEPAHRIDATIRDLLPNEPNPWNSIVFQPDSSLSLKETVRYLAHQLLECARLLPKPPVPDLGDLPRAVLETLPSPESGRTKVTPPASTSRPPLQSQLLPSDTPSPNNHSPKGFEFFAHESPFPEEGNLLSEPGVQPGEPGVRLNDTHSGFKGVSARLNLSVSRATTPEKFDSSAAGAESIHAFNYRIFPSVSDAERGSDEILDILERFPSYRNPAIALPPPTPPRQPDQKKPSAPSNQGTRPQNTSTHQTSDPLKNLIPKPLEPIPGPQKASDKLLQEDRLAKPFFEEGSQIPKPSTTKQGGTPTTQPSSNALDAELLTDTLAQLLQLESDLRGLLP